MRALSVTSIGLMALGVWGYRAAAVDSVPVPELAGRWVFNKEKSDDPGKKIREAMQSGRGMGGGRGPGGGRGGPGAGMGPGGGRGGPGGGMGPGGGRGGPGGGMGPGGGPGGHGGGMGPDGPLVAEPPLDGPPDEAGRDDAGRGGRSPRGPVPSPRLTIDQDGDFVSLRSDDNERAFQANGKSQRQDGPRGPIQVTARWRKGALEVESKGERGGARTERYTIDPDGRLRIDYETSGSGPMPGFKFRLVYDRLKDA